jgi:hypothetical protein
MSDIVCIKQNDLKRTWVDLMGVNSVVDCGDEGTCQVYLNGDTSPMHFKGDGRNAFLNAWERFVATR